MSPTQESENRPTVGNESTAKRAQAFKSIEQFAAWLDADLDLLVSGYENFETDNSVRKFFKRS